MTINRQHRAYVPTAVTVYAAFALGLFILAASLVALTVTLLGGDPYRPLYGKGYSEPQPVCDVPFSDTTAPVCPTEGAIVVRAGATIFSVADKCSREVGVGITGASVLVRIKPAPLPPPVVVSTGSRIAEKGCFLRSFGTRIPFDTEPGTYQFTGSEKGIGMSGDSQQIVWETHHFEVVP